MAPTKAAPAPVVVHARASPAEVLHVARLRHWNAEEEVTRQKLRDFRAKGQRQGESLRQKLRSRLLASRAAVRKERASRLAPRPGSGAGGTLSETSTSK